MAKFITAPIKDKVSKQKIRFTEDGFNLDLTYITENVIAMGLPAESAKEKMYRNNMSDVQKFLETRHPANYKVYNLCSEKQYDSGRFERYAYFPFRDHKPPPIELIQEFCRDMELFLRDQPDHVAAVHCKAGKGRTGTMICCYLLHTRRYKTAEEVLEFYGKTRTYDGKGVTIPSQRLYVGYYSRLLSENLKYEPRRLRIVKLKLSNVPRGVLPLNKCFIAWGEDHKREVECSGSVAGNATTTSGSTAGGNGTAGNGGSGGIGGDAAPDDGERNLTLRLTNEPVTVWGDVEIKCIYKRWSTEKHFHCAFNTFFIDLDHSQSGALNPDGTFSVVMDIDEVCKVFKSNRDFKIELVFRQDYDDASSMMNNNNNSLQTNAPSPSSSMTLNLGGYHHRQQQMGTTNGSVTPHSLSPNNHNNHPQQHNLAGLQHNLVAQQQQQHTGMMGLPSVMPLTPTKTPGSLMMMVGSKSPCNGGGLGIIAHRGSMLSEMTVLQQQQQQQHLLMGSSNRVPGNHLINNSRQPAKGNHVQHVASHSSNSSEATNEEDQMTSSSSSHKTPPTSNTASMASINCNNNNGSADAVIEGVVANRRAGGHHHMPGSESSETTSTESSTDEDGWESDRAMKSGGENCMMRIPPDDDGGDKVTGQGQTEEVGMGSTRRREETKVHRRMSDGRAEGTIPRSQSSEELIEMRVTEDERIVEEVNEQERISFAATVVAGEEETDEFKDVAKGDNGRDVEEMCQDIQLMVATDTLSPCGECRSRSQAKTTLC